MKGAAVVETGLIAGIAVYLGMKVIEVPGANGGLDSNIMAMGQAILDAFEENDFVLCNLKGGDIAGHDGDAQAKVKFIERIDEVVGFLMKNLSANTYIAMTADHATPVGLGDHSGDTVPVVTICGEYISL